MTLYDFVAPRIKGDVPRLYVEARVVGLEVSHYERAKCHTFDGLPVAGCELGVFRNVGSLIFYKDDRRWEVRANSDATAADLSTLISLGLDVNRKRGRTPGHWTRKKEFRHLVSQRTGKPIACVGVAYRLDADDLLGATTEAEEPTSTGDGIQSILAGDALDATGWMEVLS